MYQTWKSERTGHYIYNVCLSNFEAPSSVTNKLELSNMWGHKHRHTHTHAYKQTRHHHNLLCKRKFANAHESCLFLNHIFTKACVIIVLLHLLNVYEYAICHSMKQYYFINDYWSNALYFIVEMENHAGYRTSLWTFAINGHIFLCNKWTNFSLNFKILFEFKY